MRPWRCARFGPTESFSKPDKLGKPGRCWAAVQGGGLVPLALVAGLLAGGEAQELRKRESYG